MNKKNPNLLTLISGDQIHLSPEKKVIDGDLFSTLLDGEEIIKKVKDETKQYKIKISNECEALKDQAEIEGFKAGFEKWIEKINELEERIDLVQENIEKVIVPVALQAAKKIVVRVIELDREVILDIVQAHLKAVAQHKKVTLWVSPGDLEILSKKKQELKEKFEGLEVFNVRPREDLTPGGCIIETESGIINATFENQWAIIENAFERMKV
ncbi:FliH/SctL family protein [Chlamydiales bacterium]|nr:FliH/SctL family protein [Chlamydiales bacterium]